MNQLGVWHWSLHIRFRPSEHTHTHKLCLLHSMYMHVCIYVCTEGHRLVTGQATVEQVVVKPMEHVAINYGLASLVRDELLSAILTRQCRMDGKYWQGFSGHWWTCTAKAVNHFSPKYAPFPWKDECDGEGNIAVTTCYIKRLVRRQNTLLTNQRKHWEGGGAE